MPDPTVYAVRLLPLAREAIDAERDRLFGEFGLDAAMRWLQTVDTVLSSLAVFPHCCAVARESVLLPSQVRQLFLPPQRPRWRLLFTVHEGATRPRPCASICSAARARLRWLNGLKTRADLSQPCEPNLFIFSE